MRFVGAGGDELMNPYLSLRGWKEAAGVFVFTQMPLLFDLPIYSLFGPNLEFPTTLFNLEPLVAALALALLLGSRWDARYEKAVTVRSVVPQRAVLVGIYIAACAVVVVEFAFYSRFSEVPIKTAVDYLAVLAPVLVADELWGTRAALWVGGLCALVLGFAQWFVGEHWLVGDVIGRGQDPVLLGCLSAAGLLAAAWWVWRGRATSISGEH